MPQFTAAERWVEIWSQSWLDDDLDRARSLAVNDNNPVPLIAIAFSGRADRALAEVCASAWAKYHAIRKLVHQVIIAGASTTPTTDGFPPMMAAVDRFRMNPAAIAELLEHGVPADTQPPGKWSALRAALCAHDAQPGVIRMLLRAGADPLRADEYSTTPAEMAMLQVKQIAWIRRRWADFSTPDHRLPRDREDEVCRICQIYALIAAHLRERGQRLPDSPSEPKLSPESLVFDLMLRFLYERPTIVDGMRTALGVFSTSHYAIPQALYAIDVAERTPDLAASITKLLAGHSLPNNAASLVLCIDSPSHEPPKIELIACSHMPNGDARNHWRAFRIWPDKDTIASRECTFDCPTLRRLSDAMQQANTPAEVRDAIFLIYAYLFALTSMPLAARALLDHHNRLEVFVAGAFGHARYVATLSEAQRPPYAFRG